MRTNHLLFLSFVLHILCGCAKDPVSVPVVDGIGKIRVGNVEIVFDENGIGGKSITANNANDRAVGVYVVNDDEPSTIVFSDGWIGQRNSSTHRGVNFEFGWKLKVTVVVYNSVGEGFAAFLDALGPGFLDRINEIWIQEKHEVVVVLKK